jgi:hypothetical protein
VSVPAKCGQKSVARCGEEIKTKRLVANSKLSKAD